MVTTAYLASQWSRTVLPLLVVSFSVLNGLFLGVCLLVSAAKKAVSSS